MTTAYLSCDTYKNEILSGFTRLQKQQEFVDMTLAADGHLVKVHKNILALASPYIKAMLQSVSSQNPVIFLNNVSHKLLLYLLEYVYQGEVTVPTDSLELFLKTLQSLEIGGFSKCHTSKSDQNIEKSVTKQPLTLDKTDKVERPSNVAASITISSDHNLEVQQFHENVPSVDDSSHKNNVTKLEIVEHNMPILENYNNNDTLNVCSRDMDIDMNFDYDQQTMEHDNETASLNNSGSFKAHSETPLTMSKMNQPLNFKLDEEAADALKTITQYSVTERGSVQIIVSRFLYCSHHNSKGGRAHRWRCVDYRKLRCPAYIDTLDNKIVLRHGAHKHDFHDDRIMKKKERGLIFNSIKQALKATELHGTVNSSLEEAESAILPDTNCLSECEPFDDYEKVIKVLAIRK